MLFICLLSTIWPSSPASIASGLQGKPETALATKEVPKTPPGAFRVFSWNVGGRRFTNNATGIRSLIRLADPDIFLLDEISGESSAEDVTAVLRGVRGPSDTTWHVVIGSGGGYQHGAIASRHPVKPVPEFQLLPYPKEALQELHSLMDEETWERLRPGLAAGIPVGAGIIQMGKRTLLGVSLDLQCCVMGGWQERRRMIEIREIRKALQSALNRISVDAVILAGDFNTVSTDKPLAIITNPYPAPHFALVPVETIQLDGKEWWTWDGRETPYPSNLLDFSLYSPGSLEPLRAWILSTEDLPASLLAEHGLQAGSSRGFSDHLPILVDYQWRSRAWLKKPH
jgi:endonuclease/exonuclease/phosphatase family metal-dependent hydrolase